MPLYDHQGAAKCRHISESRYGVGTNHPADRNDITRDWRPAPFGFLKSPIDLSRDGGLFG